MKVLTKNRIIFTVSLFFLNSCLSNNILDTKPNSQTIVENNIKSIKLELEIYVEDQLRSKSTVVTLDGKTAEVTQGSNGGMTIVEVSPQLLNDSKLKLDSKIIDKNYTQNLELNNSLILSLGKKVTLKNSIVGKDKNSINYTYIVTPTVL